MSGLIMGIDGGGTKSHLVLMDASGKCVTTARCGNLNHEGMEGSFTELETVLSGFITGALKEANARASDVACTVIGLAGTDTAAQHKIISEILARIGLGKFTLCNDAFLGVAAGCPGGTGICAINGTGSTMAAVDGNGRMLQVAGIGPVSNDCGGSGWYGEQVMGAVYGALFKCERPTILTEMVFKLLGVTRAEDYTEAITGGLYNETLDRNALNRFVFAAADANDAAALDILKVSAGHYSGGTIFLAEELDFPKGKTLYVTFAGSVFTKEKVKILPRLIEERVKEALPDRAVQFISLDTTPVAGAVLWAAQAAGYDISMELIREAIAAAGL
jgi:N-acetylglucosamine kinase-like BadF-type ATPase